MASREIIVRVADMEPVATMIRQLARIMESEGQEPCRYDHDDQCQTHWLHDRPCPVGVIAGLFESEKP